MATSGGDPALAEAREAFWQARHDLASTMLERAVSRGELPAGVDRRLALEVLIAPVHFRALFTDGPLDGELPRALVDLVLGGIVADPRRDAP